LRIDNPTKANEIFSDEDRKNVVAIHNGWKGFLYPFVLPADYEKRSLGINDYLRSGNVSEVYGLAGMDAESIKNKILSSF
jgi:transketolase